MPYKTAATSRTRQNAEKNAREGLKQPKKAYEPPLRLRFKTDGSTLELSETLPYSVRHNRKEPVYVYLYTDEPNCPPRFQTKKGTRLPLYKHELLNILRKEIAVEF